MGPILLALLAAGCSDGAADKACAASGTCADDSGPADTDADTDTDLDTDVDADTDADTAAPLYWLGEFTTTEADGAYTFASASLGFGVFGPRVGDWACTIRGELAYEGPATHADTCPGCLWSFDLGPVEASTLAGDHCEGFVDANGDPNTMFVEGGIDTYFDWQWGFGTAYTYYAYDGTPYTLGYTLLVDAAGTGEWALFAFDYGAYETLTGDPTALSVTARAHDDGAFIYYHYYR